MVQSWEIIYITLYYKLSESHSVQNLRITSSSYYFVTYSQDTYS